MRTTTCAFLALTVLAGAALAEGEGPGRAEYVAACAGCHGEEGKGDGPVGPLLNIKVPDLTRLTASNDGAFPFLKAFMIVDGRTVTRAHGNPMPLWGERFKADAAATGEYSAELEARGRILSLILYLESIQE